MKGRSVSASERTGRDGVRPAGGPRRSRGEESSRIETTRRSSDEWASRRTRRAEEGGSPLSLEVREVVRRGAGRGTRIDLTVVLGERSVRLKGVRARHVLSYDRISKLAVEQGGVVLPHFRSADRVWREILAPAMEAARCEPSLEGEEIVDAIVAEIRALLHRDRSGTGASDLREGKSVEWQGRLLVSPMALVQAVRRRLVDDRLPKATIAEVAMSELGMREARPRLAEDVRPRAWAFPAQVAARSERREGERAPDAEAPSRSLVGTALAGPGGFRSMDHGRVAVSDALPTACELDPTVQAISTEAVDPVHGPGVRDQNFPEDGRLRAGSKGPSQNAPEPRIRSMDHGPEGVSDDPSVTCEVDPTVHAISPKAVDPVHGPRVRDQNFKEDRRLRGGSNGPPEEMRFDRGSGPWTAGEKVRTKDRRSR